MNRIHILGLGAGDLSQMPLGVYRKIQQAKHLYLRTQEHPSVTELQGEGIKFQTFDHIYEQNQHFEQVYQQIVHILLERAQEYGEIYYAVPGHPMVAEKTVQLLLQAAEEQHCTVRVIGGQSFLDPLLAALQVDPVEGFVFLDALSLQVRQLQPEQHLVLTQVYDAFVASDVKLTLMEVYPDEHQVTIANAAGSSQEQLITVPLYELDRVTKLSNLTAVYVPPAQQEQVLNRQYFRSREIFRQLRGPGGCPWDREQTHQSLAQYLLEEANEVVEAIAEEDTEHLIEELGDLLLQVFLHAQIGEDEGLFNMEDVLQALNEKMLRRHPHVFGQKNVLSPEEVIEQWERIKQEERSKK